ncbi:hypothetical protein [Nisaea sediminum]|uniref:hypothetical protein n=1 Tax=Nisaea sediminum TaxID=2775867 RepID=UPI001867329B|nr:hypothetical protein [Nisaea sediminum]
MTVTKILAALSAIAEAVAGLARFLTNRQLINAGRAAERADQASRDGKKKDAQIRALLDAPRNRDDIVKRLREGGL